MAVPTALVLVDGFELGNTYITGSTAGGGLATTSSIGAGGAMACDSGVKRSGSYSLKLTVATAVVKLVKTITATQIEVGSFYFYATAAPDIAFNIIQTNVVPGPSFRIETDGKISGLYASGTAVTSAASVCDSTWHRIDFKAITSANPYTLDWQIDGVAQTQATRALGAADILTFQIGSSTAGATFTFYIDDLVLSNTAADYPIGEHSVFGVVPTSDGTHTSAANTIETNAGTDIVPGYTTAYQLVDNLPPDTAAYIRQATVGTGEYAEVNFANHDATMTTIWDVQVLLAYCSSTNAANEGATITSTDAFSTTYEVYGTPAARTNYQASATTTPFYKVTNASSSQGVMTRPAGGWTTTNFDALQARMGYSNDVTGNPRWLTLLAQYAGTLGAAPGGQTEFVGTIPI